jgi:hypothetical protein
VIAVCQQGFWITVEYSKERRECGTSLEDSKQFRLTVAAILELETEETVGTTRGHYAASLTFVLPLTVSYPTGFLGL